MQILQLDIQGVPQAWLTPNEAATQYATDSVVWTVGDVCSTLRGGTNAYTGLLSTIDLHPIIALRGACKRSLFDVTPTLINSKLFRRDRWTCAYCGDRFDDRSLTRDHILPVSRGGQDIWSNVCASCKFCNGRKGAKTPEEAGMPLLYLPYVPSLYEDFLLAGRNIRADVNAWLSARLPQGSRLA